MKSPHFLVSPHVCSDVSLPSRPGRNYLCVQVTEFLLMRQRLFIPLSGVEFILTF